jgi:hypothetical protein
MARNKQYNEQEVIEKRCLCSGAMGIKIPRYVCWKGMGINQFSIYASFGSKHGVFVESLKCYKTKIYSIFEKLK